MKAADARRQAQLQRKRLRHAQNANETNDPRCLLAERLLRACDVATHTQPTNEQLIAAGERLDELQTSLATLHDLKNWTDRLVELQMMWVHCSARLEDRSAVRMWNKMDMIMRHVVEERDSNKQLALLCAELPPLVERAQALVQQSFIESPVGTHHESHPAMALSDAVPIRAPVELPHQWLPRVIRDICQSVEREFAAGRCRPALVDATRRILEVVRDRNPYAYLSVLYRPPPFIQNGSDVGACDWRLTKSLQTDLIARLLHADFDDLRYFAWWMEKPDSSFWKSFARLMQCVRRVAVGFHFVMIHLYAIAMQREDPAVTSNDVAREIDEAQRAENTFTLQTEGYGLARWFKNAGDAIFHETYVMFPEVLVYVDQWRREFSVYEHGFAPSERARDYEVGYHKWKSSKTWLEIAHQTKRAAQAWSRSRLGTRDYQPLTFEQLGKLEKDIKYRLSEITDLLYKQNLAKWSQQRYQHSRARVLMELQIMAEDKGIQSSDWTKGIELDSASAACDNAGSEARKIFRPPKLAWNVKLKAEAEVADSPDLVASLIDEDDILKWTDEEIDAHEKETERLYELQGQMLAVSDKFSLPPGLSDEPGEWDEASASRGLCTSFRRLRRMTGRLVSHGQEIALHGAAEALIQRPSLRATGPLSSSVCDGEESDDVQSNEPELVSPSESLEAVIRDSAVRFLNLHHAAATDPDSQESAQQLALEALSLLRRVSEQPV